MTTCSPIRRKLARSNRFRGKKSGCQEKNIKLNSSLQGEYPIRMSGGQGSVNDAINKRRTHTYSCQPNRLFANGSWLRNIQQELGHRKFCRGINVSQNQARNVHANVGGRKEKSSRETDTSRFVAILPQIGRVSRVANVQ